MVSKVDSDGPFPTIETVTSSGSHTFVEDKVDWRRVAVVDGTKKIVDRRLSNEELHANEVPDDANVLEVLD